MKYYPIMINIEGKPVTVIGAGDVAFRKIVDLLEQGACVTVIATEVGDAVMQLRENCSPERLVLKERPYREGDLAGASLVFSATNDGAVNEAVYREASDRSILINAVDDPPHCSFIVPSWFKRGDLVVSVSTGGASPSMAARIRRDLEKAIPENIEAALEAIRKARSILMNHPSFAGLDSRRRGELMKMITGDDRSVRDMVTAADDEALAALLAAAAEKGIT